MMKTRIEKMLGVNHLQGIDQLEASVDEGLHAGADVARNPLSWCGTGVLPVLAISRPVNPCRK